MGDDSGYESNIFKNPNLSLSDTPLAQPNEPLQDYTPFRGESKVLSCEHEVLKATRQTGVNNAASEGILDDVARDQRTRQTNFAETRAGRASNGYETSLSDTPLAQPNDPLQETSNIPQGESRVVSCEHEVLKATRLGGVNKAGAGGVLDDVAIDQGGR
eukprot:Phypoly_transcript_20167.p1 GENE.Phypoly_transcript_20167~~Phypoly_transcript_20167.p1  ORF type:complete len:159 (+),score=33.08 Phypoly_transcript_20167:160-636(+)